MLYLIQFKLLQYIPNNFTKRKDIQNTICNFPKFMFLNILFVVTAVGVVPCGSPKKRPRTLSIVQFIFYYGPLRSAEIF